VAAPPVAGGRFRTRGHARAVDAIRTMIAGRAPHALLIGGPPGVGKTTLAVDLAAGLLCDAPDPAARPCRECRACRLVDRGLHPDLHRLSPAGAGDQIRIGTRDNPEDGSVRRLTADLALLPVEGRARVAIIERADRMGDDAQTALLKTLEEPPSGTTIVLCADDEDRLMPTVRSRCARIRLGPVGTREIEAILADGGMADPPLAARLARLSLGRPGVSRTLALAPDAVAARDEIQRILLDLLTAGTAARFAAARELTARATDLARALDAAATLELGAAADGGGSPAAPGLRRRGATAAGAARASAALARSSASGEVAPDASGELDGDAAGEAPDDPAAAAPSASAAERRRAVGLLIGLWRELARDVVVTALGLDGEVRDPTLLDDLHARIGPADASDVAGFLGRLDGAGELLEANVRPELILDSLLLAWPSLAAPATAG
jgi:DNA polymerase III delta' subunit